MNIVPPFTTLRSSIAYQFAALRIRAWRDQFWMKLSGTTSKLLVFPESQQRLALNRKLIHLQSIRVEQIVGTLHPDSDFDHQFRPLNKHTLTRWVDTYLLHEKDGWSPILVHKVGEYYFVEDGLHRVSVARSIGMEFIEARVWEYSLYNKPVNHCWPAPCAEKSAANAYVTS